MLDEFIKFSDVPVKAKETEKIDQQNENYPNRYQNENDDNNYKEEELHNEPLEEVNPENNDISSPKSNEENSNNNSIIMIETKNKEQEMKEKKENDLKKKQIIKGLYKRINLEKFLTRCVELDQRKNYEIEKKRFKALKKENKQCTDRPYMSSRSIELCKSNSKKKPIYKRINEILETKKKNVDHILEKQKTIFERRAKKSPNEKNKNNSMDKYILKNKKKKKKKKKLSESEIESYYNDNIRWKQKITSENEKQHKDNDLKKEKEIENYFKPHLTQRSVDIIKRKKNSNDDIFYNDRNKNDNIYDKLYADSKIYEFKRRNNSNKMHYSFAPYTNRNKNRNVHAKFNDLNIKRKKIEDEKIKKFINNNNNNITEVKVMETPNHLKNAHKKMYIPNEMTIEPKKKENNKLKNDNHDNHWSKKLLNMKNNNEEEDYLYRLNVRQAAAWNENDINNVPYSGESKRIVEIFI